MKTICRLIQLKRAALLLAVALWSAHVQAGGAPFGYLKPAFIEVDAAYGLHSGNDQALRMTFSPNGSFFGGISTLPVYTPASGAVRDPRLLCDAATKAPLKISGKYWVGYTSSFSGSSTFGLVSSTDLINWTLTATPGGSTLGTCWFATIMAVPGATDFTGVHAFFSGPGGPGIYETHPTNGTMIAWSTPAPVTMAGTSTADFDIIYAGGVYHMFFGIYGGKGLGHVTSTSITGPYTTTGSTVSGFSANLSVSFTRGSKVFTTTGTSTTAGVVPGMVITDGGGLYLMVMSVTDATHFVAHGPMGWTGTGIVTIIQFASEEQINVLPFGSGFRMFFENYQEINVPQSYCDSADLSTWSTMANITTDGYLYGGGNVAPVLDAGMMDDVRAAIATVAPNAVKDGSGETNYFKHITGLVPFDPTSRFTTNVQPVSGQSGQSQIIFNPVVSGRTYTVQYKNKLTDPTWSNFSGVPSSDTGTTRTVTDTGVLGVARFYRVQISMP